MSLLDKIDKDNYNVLVTDSRCVVYSGDVPNGGIVITTAELRDHIYQRSSGSDLVLFFPVTRYFNNKHTRFIVERSPRKVTALNGKEFLIPWHYAVIYLNETTHKVESIKMYFRPFVPSVKQDALFAFPNPWTDGQCNVTEDLIELINEKVDESTTHYDTMSTLFNTLYNNFDSTKPFQSEFLPEDFDDEKTEDWTFDVFHANLSGIDLEKLLYLDYKHLSLENDKLVVGGEEKLTFSSVIATLDESPHELEMQFLDMVEAILESRE